MRDGLVLGDLTAPSVVYGVHGTTGLSKWKCLARRCGLFGSWEAVEWAWIPPGGISGEHIHTRTEEIYFILSGRGDMLIDGVSHIVEPGTVILTGLGTRHGLRNISDEGLGWLVIELLSPATSAVLRSSLAAQAPSTRPAAPAARSKDDSLMNAIIVDLNHAREVDPRAVFTGPLRAIHLTKLAANEHKQLSATGVEYTLFVTAGSGHIVSGDAKVPLDYGVSVTLPLGSEVVVAASDAGLEIFMASLDVPGSQLQ